jgi:butyryl-CoA dehydrogenase
LPLLPAIKKLMDEVMSGPGASDDRQGPLATERKLLASVKKMGLFAAGAASQKYMAGLADQQEIVGALSNCIMEIYALESCVLRAEKMIAYKGEAAAKYAIAMTRYYAAKAVDAVELSARKVIGAVAEGDMLRSQVAILRKLSKHDPANTVAIGRQIARHVIDTGRYSL